MSDDFRDVTKKMDVVYREEAIDAFKKAMSEDEFRSATGLIHKTTAYEIIQHLPSAQLERPKGEWIRKKELVPLPWDCSPLLNNDDYDADTHSVWQKYYHCSNCDWRSGEFKGGNFCPNCGADMRGIQDE